MHASCESPWHSLAKRTRLGGLLPPQVAFQEHAAHPPRWPGELSSKGSSDTCISDGVSTFLYRAFTAHGAHLILVHAHFTLAAFEARFNAGTSLDHPCQLRLRLTGRCEVILVAMLGVLIGGIRRGLRLQCAVVCERPPGDDQPLFGSEPFALQTRLHPARDHLDLHRSFLAVAHRQPPPRVRGECLAPLRHRLPWGLGPPSTPCVLGERGFQIAYRRGARDAQHVALASLP